MTSYDPSMRLHPLASLLLFLGAYVPLLLILVIKGYDSQQLNICHTQLVAMMLCEQMINTENNDAI